MYVGVVCLDEHMRSVYVCVVSECGMGVNH